MVSDGDSLVSMGVTMYTSSGLVQIGGQSGHTSNSCPTNEAQARGATNLLVRPVGNQNFMTSLGTIPWNSPTI